MANTITAKITEIKKDVKEWTWDYWTQYLITMRMDNWDWISLWKKKKDAFKVWDEVKYEVVEPGKKWKEVKEWGSRWGSRQQDQKGYFTSIAFQIAFQWFNPDKDEDWYQNRSFLAKRLLADMLDTYKEQPEEKSEEKSDSKTPAETLKEKAKSEEEDDLPF